MSSVAIRNMQAGPLGNAPGHADVLDVLGLSEGAGKRYFVGSINGSNATNRGKRVTAPLATIAAGQSKAAAASSTVSGGDTIFLLPGHAESIAAAAGIEITKNSLRIIGLGRGAKMPTITLGTATTATFKVSGVNVLIKGVRFVGNIDDLVKMIDVAGGGVDQYLTIEDCEFVTSSAKEATSFINIATTNNYVTIRRCRFIQPTDPAGTNGAANTGAIYCVNSTNVVVEDCIFDGYFETACLHNKTTKMSYLTWRRNTVNQVLSDAARVLLVQGASVGISLGVDTDYVPGRGYPANRATAAPPNASVTTAYWNVNGAPVDITSLQGEVTTAFATGGGASSLKFQANPTATGSSVDMCAVKDVNTEVVGNIMGITGTLATALQSALAIVGQSIPIRVQVGTIDATMATTTIASGSAKWCLYWMPCDTSLGVPNVIAV